MRDRLISRPIASHADRPVTVQIDPRRRASDSASSSVIWAEESESGNDLTPRHATPWRQLERFSENYLFQVTVANFPVTISIFCNFYLRSILELEVDLFLASGM